jgi:hypothetical protein
LGKSKVSLHREKNKGKGLTTKYFLLSGVKLNAIQTNKKLKKNILILSPVSPVRGINGGTLVIQSHVLMLKENYNVSVIYETDSFLENEVVDDCLKDVRLIPYVNFRISHQSLLKKSLNKFRSIYSKWAKGRTLHEVIDDYKSSRYLQIYKFKSEGLIELINKTIEEFNIELVEIHFVQWADIVYSLPKKVKSVFVHHELRSLRLETLINTLSKNELLDKKAFIQYAFEFVSAQERALLQSFDHIILISEFDSNYIKRHLGLERLSCSVVPSVVHTEIRHQFFDISMNALKFWFIGGASHPPNREGLFWLLDIIKKDREFFHPFLPVTVTGDWNDEWKRYVVEKYGDIVNVVGFVENIEDYRKNKILICSIRIGSGIRIKLIKALSMRVPILSTPEGAMGVNFEDEKEALLFNDEKTLKEKIQGVKEGIYNLEEIANNGFEKYENHYSFRHGKKAKLEIYKVLL